MRHIEFLADLEDRIHTGRPILIFFYREDSPPCLRIARSLARLTRKYPQVESYIVDLEKHPTAAGQFLAYTVPTLVLYYLGRPVFKRSDDILLPEVEGRLREAAEL